MNKTLKRTDCMNVYDVWPIEAFWSSSRKDKDVILEINI